MGVDAFSTNNPGIALNPFTSSEMTALLQIADLGDPNNDRLLFWDDSAGSFAYLTAGSGLSIVGTTITSTGGAGTGDFVGPASSTDNAIVRFDLTTGKLGQDSGVIIDDSNVVFPATSDAGTLGSGTKMWSDLFLASGAVVNFNNGNYTVTHSAGLLTTNGALTLGGTLALAANSITMTGSLAATGARVTKGWFTDLESTNMPTVGGVAMVSISSSDTLTNKTLTTPVINGTITGTGQATAATASTIMMRDASGNTNINNLGEGFTTTATAAGTTTMTITGTFTQVWTGSSTQTVKLPTTSVAQGQQYFIINQSTGAVTVQSSGANTIVILAAGTSGTFTAVVATPTTAANWDFQYASVKAASGKSGTFSNTITLAGTDATTMTFPTTSATIARTDAGNTFTGASTASAWVLTSPTITTGIVPTSNDGAALGSTANQFSDLFVASGAVLNFANGNVAVTHTSGILTMGTGEFRITSANVGTNADSVPSLSSTSTLTNKTLTSPTLQTTPVLATGTNFKFTVPTGDLTGTGITTNEFNSGYSSTAIGDLVYLDSSATWQKADADLSAAAYSSLLGVALSVAASAAPVTVLLQGFIYAATPFPTLTIGAPVYMSATAAAVTQTAPATTDSATRIVGYAVHADKMWFCPSNDWITHT